MLCYFQKFFWNSGKINIFFNISSKNQKSLIFQQIFHFFRKKIRLPRRYLIDLKKLCFWTWDYEKICIGSQDCVDCVLGLQYRFKTTVVEKPLFMFKNSPFSLEMPGKPESFYKIKTAIKYKTFKNVLGLNYKPLDTFE